MICMWSSWCHCHPITSWFSKIQTRLTFLVPACPGCPGKESTKRTSYRDIDDSNNDNTGVTVERLPLPLESSRTWTQRAPCPVVRCRCVPPSSARCPSVTGCDSHTCLWILSTHATQHQTWLTRFRFSVPFNTYDSDFQLRFYVPLETKWSFRRRSSQPISWLALKKLNPTQ